jgi:hypothetical protein
MPEVVEAPPANTLAYRIIRYTPNLVRDEWVNIGVLVFHPQTGERRLRLIEDQDEYNRVRRLHPGADEALLRALRDDLETRLDSGSGANGGSVSAFPWQNVLSKWDETLSNALQIAPQKGVLAEDLDAEAERLYSDHVAVPRRSTRQGLPGSRSNVRKYCDQVFRANRIWDRLQKSVRVAEFTFPGDPARIDYSYRRNGMRGFVHALSATRSPSDAKLLAYTAKRIQEKGRFDAEFAAVTDVELSPENERHRFVRDTLLEASIQPVAMGALASWAPKLAALLQ